MRIVYTIFSLLSSGRLAFVLTMLLSPPVVSIAAMYCLSGAFAGAGGWLWVGLHAAVAVLAPLGYVVWLVGRGQVTDIDVQLREQRVRPMLVTIACTGLAWMILWVSPAPRQMTLFAGVLCLQACLVFLVTLRWKISVHCAAVAGAAAVIGGIVEMPLLLLISVPIVAWSRVRLGRHTLAQTIAGSVLGLSLAIIALLWMW